MIDKFGADALRMSLLMDSAPGQDSRLYEEKIETFRNFANKLWNISRFCLTQENFKLVEKISEDDIKSNADHWIVYNFEKTIREITQLFESKQISIAADVLKSFTWDEFADWYVEISKTEKNQAVLGYVLDKLLRLWHPFMPFITEHIWSLAEETKPLIISEWPKDSKLSDADKALEFEIVKEIIVAIRNARAENKIEAGKKIALIIDTKLQNTKASEDDVRQLMETHTELLKNLRTGVESLEIISSGEKIENAIKRSVAGINIHIPLAGLLDVEKEKEKSAKEIANIEKFIAGLAGRLDDKNFVSKAPEHIIAQQKETLAKKQAELAELKKHLLSLN
jgi:valyl-tRNA synthetase